MPTLSTLCVTGKLVCGMILTHDCHMTFMTGRSILQCYVFFHTELSLSRWYLHTTDMVMQKKSNQWICSTCFDLNKYWLSIDSSVFSSKSYRRETDNVTAKKKRAFRTCIIDEYPSAKIGRIFPIQNTLGGSWAVWREIYLLPIVK